MNIEQWKTVVELPEGYDITKQVLQAQLLGKDAYGNVVSRIFERLMATDEFGALTGALVIGNIALDAKPYVQIDMGEGFVLQVGIKTP